VDLDSVTNLELLIIPEISGGHRAQALSNCAFGSNTRLPQTNARINLQDYRLLVPPSVAEVINDCLLACRV
jgi:hypothetical protein